MRIQVLNNYDPTRTTTLRNTFSRQMKKRFRVIRGLIRTAIVEEDCFGLITQQTTVRLGLTDNALTPGKNAFAFNTSGEKVEKFMLWLQDQVDRNILETTLIPQIGQGIQSKHWTDLYIDSAYRKGTEHARQKLLQFGYGVPDIDATGGIDAVMSHAMHADRVGLLYTRTYQDLKNITRSMEGQLSRVLAQSMAEGRNPRDIAKILTRTISGPVGDLGITDTLGRFIPAERRATILARTEIIRAHHSATIQEYRNWGAEGVTVIAEWSTAGDGRVCAECDQLANETFTLDQIENMIPLHPQCRCIAIPVDKTKEPVITGGPTSGSPDPFEGGDLQTGWERSTKKVAGRQIPFYKNPNYKKPEGASTLYHETSPEAIKSIKETGLDPYAVRRGEIWATSSSTFKKGVEGGFYAEDVVIFSVPKKEWIEDGLLVVEPGTGTILYDTIPPEWIQGFLRDYPSK